MSESEVTKNGLRGARPGREAVIGGASTRRRRRREQAMVPDTEFTSYYGKPIINAPVWEAPDVPGYLFLGGMAGAASLLGAGARLTGRPALERITTSGAAGAGALSLVALVHDLGRPLRFLAMLRVFKPSSPMSVGSWLLSGYVPMAGVAALSAVTGWMPRIGTAATVAAALTGPAVASYTAALISDTAVPAWHDGYPEMPFVFVGSGATAAGGLGLMAPVRESAPARVLAIFGTACERAAFERMERRIGLVAEPYATGRSGRYVKAGKILSVLGITGALLGRRSRAAGALSGAVLIAASLSTRWGIFHAGMASAIDPRYTVVPQRDRIDRITSADADEGLHHPPSVTLS